MIERPPSQRCQHDSGIFFAKESLWNVCVLTQYIIISRVFLTLLRHLCTLEVSAATSQIPSFTATDSFVAFDYMFRIQSPHQLAYCLTSLRFNCGQDTCDQGRDARQRKNNQTGQE